MIVKVAYINNDITRFVPRGIFIPKLDEKIWITVNEGIEVPVTCEQVISHGDKLALDGQYIEIELGKQCYVRHGDRLRLDKYEFYVVE